MSPEILGVVGLVVLLMLLFAGMWIGSAMAVVGFLGYAVIIGFGPASHMVSQIPFTTMAWYPLTCIPLFIFMGVVIYQSGVGKDLYTTAYTLVGQFRGGAGNGHRHRLCAFRGHYRRQFTGIGDTRQSRRT